MKNTNITFFKKLASTHGFNKNKIKLVTLETQHSVRCVHVSLGKIYTLIPNHIYVLEQYEFNELFKPSCVKRINNDHRH